MSDDAADAGNCPWQLLEEHFRHHARLVNHFRHADAHAVVAMWKTGTNEAGARSRSSSVMLSSSVTANCLGIGRSTRRRTHRRSDRQAEHELRATRGEAEPHRVGSAFGIGEQGRGWP